MTLAAVAVFFSKMIEKRIADGAVVNGRCIFCTYLVIATVEAREKQDYGISQAKPEMSCTNHPGKETLFRCEKDGIYLCDECLVCPNPNIYCKFRTSCIIWELQNEEE